MFVSFGPIADDHSKKTYKEINCSIHQNIQHIFYGIRSEILRESCAILQQARYGLVIVDSVRSNGVLLSSCMKVWERLVSDPEEGCLLFRRASSLQGFLSTFLSWTNFRIGMVPRLKRFRKTLRSLAFSQKLRAFHCTSKEKTRKTKKMKKEKSLHFRTFPSFLLSPFSCFPSEAKIKNKKNTT